MAALSWIEESDTESVGWLVRGERGLQKLSLRMSKSSEAIGRKSPRLTSRKVVLDLGRLIDVLLTWSSARMVVVGGRETDGALTARLDHFGRVEEGQTASRPRSASCTRTTTLALPLLSRTTLLLGAHTPLPPIRTPHQPSELRSLLAMSSPLRALALVKAEFDYEATTEDELTVAEEQHLWLLENDDPE